MSDIAFAEVATVLAAARPAIAGGFGGAAPSGFVLAPDTRSDWRAAPIEPSWIRAGTPEAAYIPLAGGADGWSTVTLWSCTEGSFSWQFVWEETVHILEGEVDVVLPSGETHKLVEGSVAFFPAQSTAVWTVVRPVRKLAICRRAVPGKLARLIKAVSHARKMLGFA